MKRLVVCVVLVGCAGDDSGGNGAVAIDNLGMEMGTASCGKQFECCTDAEIMQQYMNITIDGQPITTEEQCVSLANGLITGYAIPGYKESIAMGRIEYDGAAAADCVAALAGLTCSEYSALQSSRSGDIGGDCRPFIIAKVGDGGGCTQDYECTSDNCVGATVVPDGPDTDGTCMPMPTAGQACDDNCADGSYCAYDLDAAMDICQELKPDGEQCSYSRECASEVCDSTSHTCTGRPLVCDGQ